MTPRIFFGVLPILWLGACAAPSPEPVEPGIGRVVVTQWNDSTELFLEYPHRVAGVTTGNWAIHMTDRTDFQPIRSGTLSVRFTAAGGQPAEAFTIEAPLRNGIFVLDPVIARPGDYGVELELMSDQARSTHVLETVHVYASLAEAPVESVEPEAQTGIAFLKEQQWVIPFDVQPAAEREVQGSISAPAELVAPDGALVQVSAPLDGIAPADANRSAPSVGSRVRAGQELAVLAPATQEGGYAEVRGRVERLELEAARAERLAAVGAIPQRRLEDARRDLDVARSELEAMGGASGDSFLLRLTSPIDGVVAARDFVPGGRVGAGVPLFTVVDPSTAWLRVQLPVAYAASIDQGRARFSLEGSQEVRETTRLLSVGNVVDPRTRTVPVIYLVAGGGAPFAFGQIASAFVPQRGTQRGIAVPQSAVLDESGSPVAYVQAEGETFERRPLMLGATDGSWVIVLSGIESGDMVVTEGAYQVRLASLSGNEFAGGHTH